MAPPQPDASGNRLEVRILRCVLVRPAQAHEERVGVEPADAHVGAPVRGEAEQPRQPERPELEARRADRERHGSREGRPHLRDGRLQLGGRDPLRIDLHGQIDRERTLQRRERLHDRARRGVTLEPSVPSCRPERPACGVRAAATASR